MMIPPKGTYEVPDSARIPFFFGLLVYLKRRHRTLFHDAVRKHYGRLSVEEIEHTVIEAMQPNPQFIDSVPQIINIRAA